MNQEAIILKTRQWIVITLVIALFLYLERQLQLQSWEAPGAIFEMKLSLYVFLPLVIAGVFIHEFIHGVFFASFAKTGYKSVSYDFKSFSPSCYCSDPLTKNHFMISAIAPFILLGLIPLIISYSIELKWVRNFGILFSIGGFGDLWFFISLLFKKGKFSVIDHPDKNGIYLVEKTDQ